jgi:PAS domain S-box-containing protein
VYKHLPFLVVHLTTDGTVLHCNPETIKVTGYSEAELVGNNFWALLFPGKLFAQVPKFISLIHPTAGLLKDVPMTLRTRQGAERIIAWTRHMHAPAGAEAGSRSFICIGVDLTDRLQDADRTHLPERAGHEEEAGGLMTFGPHVGNAGAIEGEIVTPLAITPRLPDRTGVPCVIEQVREGLARVETHIHCVEGAFMDSEIKAVEALRAALNSPANGKALELFARRDGAQISAGAEALAGIHIKVGDLLKLYRPEMP